MPRAKLFLIAAMLSVATHGHADGIIDTFRDGSWSFAPLVSFIDDDVDRDVDDGYSGLQLGLNKQLNDATSLEFSALLTSFNADGFDADQRQWGIGVDVIYHFQGSDYFAPYFLVGTGFLTTQTDGLGRRNTDGSGLTASLAAGVATPPVVFGASLRTELRLRHDRSTAPRSDIMLSVGVWRALGAKPAPKRDADGDGVADDEDRCGNTPPGATIDGFGCARGGDGRDR